MQNYGRLSSNGMQGVMREFRGFLMGQSTTDLDQENSHPVILSYLCHIHNINCDAVDEYNTHRDRVLETFLPISRGDAKCELLKCINRDIHNKNNKNLFYKKWDKDIRRIQVELLNIAEFKHIIDTVPVDKEFNKIGSQMSRILCHHENLILQVALKIIQDENIELATLMADGCMIYGDHYANTDLLEKVKNGVNDAFEGLNMNWTYKAHNTDIVIPEGWKSKKLQHLVKEEKKENLTQACIEKYIPFDLGSDVGVVKFLLAKHPDKFIWVREKGDSKGTMYSWTGKRWELGNLEFIRFLSGEGIDMLHDVMKTATNDLLLSNPELLKVIVGVLKNTERTFQMRSRQIPVIDTSEAFLSNETIKFDDNTDIIGFNNGVYDLVKHEFRPTQYDDYITMSCGYDYSDEIDPDKLKELEDLLETIIPDIQNRNLLLEILSCGLTGRSIEKFIIFNGGGRNGKGLIDEFLKIIYGEYALIYANVSLLTEKDKTGANPEKAAIHNKRIVIMKEPEGNEPLRNDRVKDITGGGNISGRMLYSNNTIINLHLLLIMECNERPKFKTEPTHAEEERTIDLLFPNRFTTLDDEIDGITVFKADSKYKTDEWKESHRIEFLHLIIKSFKQFQQKNYVFTIPQNVKERTQSYLNSSFPILEIFLDLYVKTNVKTDVVKLGNVFDKIKNTEIFNGFDKAEKRKYNYKYFCGFVEKNRVFKGDYIDAKMINGIRYQNILTGYKLITTEVDTTGSDDDNNTIDPNYLFEEI
jgi:hypothetical protein